MADTFKYLSATDEIEKSTAVKVVVPFKQYENELATLIAQRDGLQVKIDELQAVVNLKV